MSQKLAKLISAGMSYKPQGHSSEKLALINNHEMQLLKQHGGAGEMTQFGVPSFHGGGMNTAASSPISRSTPSTGPSGGFANAPARTAPSSNGGSGPGAGVGSNQGGGGSAMQGGFGAQAFGRSTASTNAVSNAVRSGGSSGGAWSSESPRFSNSGTAVPGGYGAQAFGRAATSQLPSQYQNRGWTVNGQPLAPSGVTHIGPAKTQDRIAPSAPTMIAKDQSRVPRQPTASDYANYQQPPGYANPATSMVSLNDVPQIQPSGIVPDRTFADRFDRYPSGYQGTQDAVAGATNSGPHARPQLETAFADPVNSFAGIENLDPRFVDPRKGYYDQNGVTPQTQFANRLREETQLHGMNPNDKAIAAQMGSLMNENLHAYMTPASNPWDIGSAASFGNFKNIGTNPDGKVTAGGSAQWNSGRLNQVNDFFKQNGINPNDPNNQAAAVAAETAGHLPGQRGNYKDTYNALSGMSLPNATQSWMRNYENPSYNPDVNRIANRQDSAQQFAGNFPSSNYQDTQMDDWNTLPQIQIASTNDAPIDQTARNPFPFKAGSPEYVAARQQANATNNASVPVQVANFVQKHAPGIGGLLDDGGGIYGNSGNSGNSGGGIYGNSGNSGNSGGGVRLAGFANNSGDNGSKAAIINSAIDAALGHTATPPAVTSPVASQGPIGPAYSIATAQGNYIVDSHGQYFMLDRTGAYMPVAPPRGAVA